MGTIEATILGTALLAIAIFVLSYYSAWVFVVPYLDSCHDWVQRYFLPRQYAVTLPAALLVVGLAAGATVFTILSKQKKS
jgi:dolichyl-phosphate mannosyltransferase polypeptide 2 regulatory subunit